MSKTDGRTEIWALALGGTALILVLVSWWFREPSRVSIPGSSQGLEELRAAQSVLERRLDEIEARSIAMQGSGPEPRLPVAPAAADLTSRIEALEAEAAASAELRRSLEQAARSEGLVVLRPPEPGSREPEMDLAELRTQAINGALSEEERLRALRRLRSMGEGARNGEVALAMIEMAMRSQDPLVRADVWRQMSGAEDPALVQPLLQSLAGDTEQGVREEAAETLADFLDQPGVRAALEYAMTSDASEEVRRQARSSLRIR